MWAPQRPFWFALEVGTEPLEKAVGLTLEGLSPAGFRILGSLTILFLPTWCLGFGEGVCGADGYLGPCPE